MAWKMVSIATRKLTKPLVAEFKNMERLPHDRSLRPSRKTFLRGEVDAGRFRTCEWASVAVKETGTTYRVNGKHTSEVFDEMPELPTLSVVVEQYECDTMQDAAELYATFDARECSRSMHEINQAYKASIPQLADVRSKVIDVCVHGMSFAQHEERYSNERSIERAQRLEEHWDFVVWAQQFMCIGGALTDHRGRNLTRGPVAAAMFRTYKIDKAAATEFWTMVRDESARVGDPTRVLARYLLTTGLLSGTTTRHKAAPREIYVKCLHAYNAWIAGENTTLRYYPEAPTPKITRRAKKVG